MRWIFVINDWRPLQSSEMALGDSPSHLPGKATAANEPLKRERWYRYSSDSTPNSGSEFLFFSGKALSTHYWVKRGEAIWVAKTTNKTAFGYLPTPISGD
jgi:hypothetical protein